MQLGQAVLGGDTAEIVGAIRDDGLDSIARLGIYRNHFFTRSAACCSVLSRWCAA
jgi:hypothetical protein